MKMVVAHLKIDEADGKNLNCCGQSHECPTIRIYLLLNKTIQ